MDRTRLWLAAAVAAATMLRLWLASSLPLVDDEAYYWAWSRHLAAGYPDHPPAVAWMIGATTGLIGDTPLGVRAGAVLLSAGIAFLLYDLGRLMYGPRAGVVAAIGYQLIPAFSVGSIFAFPDAPFVFFWVLTLWALWRARTGGRRTDWLLAGLAAGLAAASKMNAAFLAASVLGFLLWTPAERRWWRRAEPYGAAGVALLAFLPVLLWNAEHHWVTFRRVQNPAPWVDTGVPALNAAAFAGAQLAYYGLLSAPLLVAALARLGSAGKRSDIRSVYLLWGALPILVITWLTSFDGIPKPHWHAPGLLIALVAAGAAWEAARGSAWRWVTMGAAAALNLIVIAVVVLLPFRPDYAGAGQLWGWDQTAAQTAALLEATPERPGRFILMTGYQTAGQMDYQLRGRHLITTPFGGDAYALWVRKQALHDWNAIVLTDLSPGPGLPLARMFARIEQLPDVEVVRGGQVVRRFNAYRGFGFRGLPRPRLEPI